jgi:ankyrin repeat protein
MAMDASLTEAYFDAVRNNDVSEVERLLTQQPTLALARWRGRGQPDGKIRSLGPSPYNQHTWFEAPISPDNPDDPRYTSTPLHWTRDDAMVRVLVAHGADVNARGTSGEWELPDWFLMPLWRAAHDGRIESVQRLVAHGADVNVFNPDGCNQALKTAIENGSAEVCDYLLAQGARPDIHCAAMLGRVEEVRQLGEADPVLIAHRDEHGRTPLDAALLMDSFRVHWPQTEAQNQVAEWLIGQGAEPDLAHLASLGWTDQVKQRIEADPQVVHQQRSVEPLLTGAAEFETALEVARRRQREDVLQILLSV